jgi:pyrrolidone-carboxylate peptidase
MNERIQELLKQATKEVDPHDRVWVFSKVDQAKFAELIVRECIDKIETHQIPVGNSAAGEMACEWTYAALKEIRDEIKQHFGVEE